MQLKFTVEKGGAAAEVAKAEEEQHRIAQARIDAQEHGFDSNPDPEAGAKTSESDVIDMAARLRRITENRELLPQLERLPQLVAEKNIPLIIAGLAPGRIVHLQVGPGRVLPALVTHVENHSTGICLLWVFGVPKVDEPPLFPCWARYDGDAAYARRAGHDFEYKEKTWHFPPVVK